jgi:hypothetical protein
MMYKIINNLIDIRAEEYLTKPTRQLAIPWSTNSSQHPQITTNTVSSHRPPVFGIPCQHQLLRLPVWYLSNRSCPLPLSKLRVVKLYLVRLIGLCWFGVYPVAVTVARVNYCWRYEHATWQIFRLFLWLSYIHLFYLSYFLCNSYFFLRIVQIPPHPPCNNSQKWRSARTM